MRCELSNKCSGQRALKHKKSRSHRIWQKLEQDIEKALSELPQDQMIYFVHGTERFHTDAWDEQIAKDAAGGKLDAFAEAAIADHKAGKSKKL